MVELTTKLDKLKVIWASLFFSSLFTIHFQILPFLKAETQPILPLILLPWGVMLLNDFKLEWQLLLKFLLFLLVLVVHLIILPGSLLELLKYLVGPLFLFLPVSWWYLIPERVILGLLTFLLILTLLVLGDVPYLKQLIHYVIGDRSLLDISLLKGLAIIAPEPSYFVFFLMLGLVASHLQETLVKPSYLWLWRAILVLLAILTVSFYVYLILAIYFFSFLPNLTER